ncbi:hypothetical protein HGP16_27150 [Rhizobium sp. P40RR-XXII]|uniref:hypothetical protein n=1 Tax=unclassified Rhizobium TaxID=2613769 RepID=UPI0014575218|nr:hypothetical protein [Rhizobium sp. P28RR-XV]NLS20216.1 hypothetical protein [Rhizobium sp. P40RR-XXII]
MFREEWAYRAQGKKVLEGRCGRTIEAKPVFDQTCLIEPAKDVAWLSGQKEYGDGSCAPTACRIHATVRLPPQYMSKSNTQELPNKGVALAVLRTIVVLEHRRLEDPCLSSQSRLLWKSSGSGALNRLTGKPRSPANWTSQLIPTRSSRWGLNSFRSLASPTTDADGVLVASRSSVISGCRECGKPNVRCACAAA